MNVLPGLRLRMLCLSLLVLLHTVRGTDSAVATATVDSCSCRKSCLRQLDSTQDDIVSIPSFSSSSSSSSSSSFYFDIILGSCVQLPPLCETNANCTFADKTRCDASCGSGVKVGENKGSESGGAKLGGCEATKFGCCPDGSARTESRRCRQPMDKAGPPRSPNGLPSSSSQGGMGKGVRWDLVVSGVCVMVLLVAVLTVTGVVTYNYRLKKKERIRSRYIRDVLEMYDSESDSSSSDGEGGGQCGREATKHHKLEL